MTPDAADSPPFVDWDSPEYARYRPMYPEELFERVADHCTRHRTAWDCAAGSGQATTGLTRHFHRVLATDLRIDQITRAPAGAGSVRAAANAYAAPITDHTVDLVAVAQALHWFPAPRFFDEVSRVAAGGTFAAWTYGLLQAGAEIDPLIESFYADVVGPYWPPERAHIEDEYARIEIPFAPRARFRVPMHLAWTVQQTLGYLGTWSAVRRYRTAHRTDPIADLVDPLTRLWGPGVRTVRWPLTVHVYEVR